MCQTGSQRMSNERKRVEKQRVKGQTKKITENPNTDPVKKDEGCQAVDEVLREKQGSHLG